MDKYIKTKLNNNLVYIKYWNKFCDKLYKFSNSFLKIDLNKNILLRKDINYDFQSFSNAILNFNYNNFKINNSFNKNLVIYEDFIELNLNFKLIIKPDLDKIYNYKKIISLLKYKNNNLIIIDNNYLNFLKNKFNNNKKNMHIFIKKNQINNNYIKKLIDIINIQESMLNIEEYLLKNL